MVGVRARNTTHFLIIDEVKEVLDFSHGTAKVL